MDLTDKLKLDYEQTTKYFHELAAVRFRLLAFLPLVTGTAVGALQLQKPDLVIPLSIFGIVVTFGIMCYDQRNSQIYNAMQLRAKSLEARMRLESVNGRFQYGGAFLDRPERSLRFLGILMWHDRGLAIVYAAVLAAWFYILTSALVQLWLARIIAAAVPSLVFVFLRLQALVPLAVFVVAFRQLQALDKATDVPDALPEKIRRELKSE